MDKAVLNFIEEAGSNSLFRTTKWLLKVFGETTAKTKVCLNQLSTLVNTVLK